MFVKWKTQNYINGNPQCINNEIQYAIRIKNKGINMKMNGYYLVTKCG